MAKTTYMWDELSDNVAAEYDDSVLSAAYSHEPGLYGNLLSQNRNGVTSYYHYDGRGDTIALTDDSGNVTDTKEYDAWGNVIASTGSTATPYQFIGRGGYQTALSRVYVRARLYQPTIARWFSPDPLGFLDSANLYLYTRNQALHVMDPSGNVTCCLDSLAERKAILEWKWQLYATYDRWDDIRKLVVKSRCPFPKIECCEEIPIVFRENPQPCDICATGANGGNYSPKTAHGQSTIVICSKPGASWLDYYQTFDHELSHAITNCQGGWTENNLMSCEELICDELRAYAHSGICEAGTEIQKQECLATKAARSAEGNPSCESVPLSRRRKIARELAKFSYCTDPSLANRKSHPKPKQL